MSVSDSEQFDIQQLISRLPGSYYRARNDQFWTIEYISPSIMEMVGYASEALTDNQELAFVELIHPDDRSYCEQVVAAALEQNQPFSLQYRVKARDGRERWCWEQGTGRWDEQLQCYILEGFLTDVTEQREREQKLSSLVSKQQRSLEQQHHLLEQYRRAVDAGCIVSKTDATGKITFVNDEFCRISGFSREELLGQTHTLVRHPETPPALFGDMWRTIRSGSVWKGVIRNRSYSGHDYYVNSTIIPFFNEEGQICEFMSLRHDVTDLMEKESLLRRQTTDTLTGLPNRQKLQADIEHQAQCTLALINVIDFSEVNEYFGYRVGDRLLQHLAVVLDGCLLADMQLYRLAGDEFAVLSLGAISAEAFTGFCQRMIQQVSQHTMPHDGQELSISVAVGAASGSNAFIEADIALHTARAGQRSFELFDGESSLREQIESNIRWVRRIRDAIYNNRIHLYAQPIICSYTGKVAKYECLMRLEDEDGQVYTPWFFLEAAKRARLYTCLTRLVIRQAFSFFAKRKEVFSINLTAHDMLDHATVEFLLSEAQRLGVADRLVLELVESEGIENFEQVSQFLARARAIGCRIAVDDFGTGYSNFEYLLKLDIDFIKIDGSLIRQVDQDGNARMVAETVVDFARRLGLKTVAEFVHNDSVKVTAEEIGVDYLQGFLLGEPVPLAEIER
ncbi:MAG: EAL domain-containing protein [Marinobacterium sp.]|nr:EAL domain-containing protein [Marinobacterium sp.]